MEIGFVVNDIYTETPGYTTTRLAYNAIQRGHKVWVIKLGDFTYDPEGTISALAYTCSKRSAKTPAAYISMIQNKRNKPKKIKLTSLDVLMLRSDPAQEIAIRPWAQFSGIVFGHITTSSGTIVLNDPTGLSKALNKMYFQAFPESVRPRTLISRDPNEIRKFAKNENGNIILKPIQGSGGQNVFLVKKDEKANINQMIEAISRDGYVIAQEYLPKASQGDTRLFMMNGKPLKYKGKIAAFRRIRANGDIRSNVHAGGRIEQAKITDKILELAEIVRPKLVQDGMFLVGLDIAGDKLIEINVFSPGGLGSAQKFEGVNFSEAVIKALEHKVEYLKHYNLYDNLAIATL